MSNRLPILAAEIRQAHLDTLAAEKTAAERAIAAGEALAEAKSLVRHGQWLPFLKAAGVPERTAQRYMLLHRAGLKPAIVADLGLARAEKFASLGLSLMPGPDKAICATGVDIDRDMLSGCVSYWWQEGDGVRYFHCSMFDDRAWYHRPGHTLPIWMIGCLEGDRAQAYDRWATEPVPLADAIAFLNQFEAHGGANG